MISWVKNLTANLLVYQRSASSIFSVDVLFTTTSAAKMDSHNPELLFDVKKARAFTEIQDYKKLSPPVKDWNLVHAESSSKSATASQRYLPGMYRSHISARMPLTAHSSDLSTCVKLKTTGVAGKSGKDVNLSELKACGSVFATALRKHTSTDELQTLADRLSKQGWLAINPHAAIALKTFIHYLRSLRLNIS